MEYLFVHLDIRHLLIQKCVKLRIKYGEIPDSIYYGIGYF